MDEDEAEGWDSLFSLAPLVVTTEILEMETLPLRYPPKNLSAPHLQFTNKDHYVATKLFWGSVLDNMFMEKEYANKMACLKNLNFFLESGIIKTETRDILEDGEEYIGVKAWYWCFTEGAYSYIEEMEMMDIEFLARMMEYYGGVN